MFLSFDFCLQFIGGFFACSYLLTISTATIHSQLLILLTYAILPFFPNPAFMNIPSCGQRVKFFPNPTFRFGTERVQAIRDETAWKILLKPVALDWNRHSGCSKVADEE